jgi:hypothetical protein
LPAPEIEQSLAAAGCHILSDRTEIATATQLIGLADNRLPAIFSVAELWRMRLQSEVDAGGALNALVDRIDLSGDFKYPAGAQIAHTVERQAACGKRRPHHDHAALFRCGLTGTLRVGPSVAAKALGLKTGFELSRCKQPSAGASLNQDSK